MQHMILNWILLLQRAFLGPGQKLGGVYGLDGSRASGLIYQLWGFIVIVQEMSLFIRIMY